MFIFAYQMKTLISWKMYEKKTINSKKKTYIMLESLVKNYHYNINISIFPSLEIREKTIATAEIISKIDVSCISLLNKTL